jgi:hypothetical protein
MIGQQNTMSIDFSVHILFSNHRDAAFPERERTHTFLLIASSAKHVVERLLEEPNCIWVFLIESRIKTAKTAFFSFSSSSLVIVAL